MAHNPLHFYSFIIFKNGYLSRHVCTRMSHRACLFVMKNDLLRIIRTIPLQYLVLFQKRLHLFMVTVNTTSFTSHGKKFFQWEDMHCQISVCHLLGGMLKETRRATLVQCNQV